MTDNINKFIDNVNAMKSDERFRIQYSDDRTVFFMGDVIRTNGGYALVTAGTSTDFDDVSRSIERRIVLYNRVMADGDVRFMTVMKLGGWKGFDDDQWKVGDLEARE